MYRGTAVMYHTFVQGAKAKRTRVASTDGSGRGGVVAIASNPGVSNDLPLTSALLTERAIVSTHRES